MQSHSFYKINSERLINKGIEIGTEMQKNRDRKGEGKERDKIKVSFAFFFLYGKKTRSFLFASLVHFVVLKAFVYDNNSTWLNGKVAHCAYLYAIIKS